MYIFSKKDLINIIERVIVYQFFPTPINIISDLIDLGIIQDHDTILEPGAGQGDIIRRVKECYPNTKITAVDIATEFVPHLNQAGADTIIIQDLHSVNFDQKFDKIICNPPFSDTQRFVEKCHSLLKENDKMSFLLRLSLFC